MNLLERIRESEKKGIAIGHFNISDSTMLKAIFETAKELNLPVLIGASEGEREFIGTRETALLVRGFRDEFSYPIFLNADHTHSVEKAKEAARAGYDAILFDGGKLPFEENIRQTKEVVAYVKSLNPEILVEGELGYIGSGSEVLKEIPAGAAIKLEELTSPEGAHEFVERTGIDLLAPAVGNIHGIIVQEGFKERLNIERIGAIKRAARIPLVLHGGSGLPDEDFTAAIAAGINIVHISTEVRVAWREGIEEGLKKRPDEVAPYKIEAEEIEGIKKVVRARLKLFAGLK